MIKFLNPSYVFRLTGKLLNFLKTFVIPMIVVGLIFSLFVSPKDYIQGDAVRIMYVHVPSAWLSLSCFSVITFLSVLSLSLIHI